MTWNSWIIGWVQKKSQLMLKKLVISKSPRKLLSDEIKIKPIGKSLYPSNLVHYLGVNDW